MQRMKHIHGITLMLTPLLLADQVSRGVETVSSVAILIGLFTYCALSLVIFHTDS